MKRKEKGRNFERFILISRRALPIFHAFFLELFAFDSESAPGFVIHSIPFLLILGAVSLSWKNERFGIISFLALGLVATVFFRTWREPTAFALVSLPLFLSAGLCLVGRKLGKAP